MRYEQEPKYDAIDGRLVNRSTGKPIPDDEPVFIFRAQDRKALAALKHYRDDCEHPEQKAAIDKRIEEFTAYQKAHPDRVKEPD